MMKWFNIGNIVFRLISANYLHFYLRSKDERKDFNKKSFSSHTTLSIDFVSVMCNLPYLYSYCNAPPIL